MSVVRRATLSLAAVLIGTAVALAFAEIASRIVMPHWSEYSSARFLRPIDVPGYGEILTGRPGFDGNFAQNNGDFRVRVTVNRFGLREAEPVSSADDRVWFVGDSFGFGWGVTYDEAFPGLAGRMAGMPAYNLSGPGADLCDYHAQVARMPDNLVPRALVVGLTVENDVREYQCPRGRASAAPAAEGGSALSKAAIKEYLTETSALYNLLAVALKRVGAVRRLLVAVGLVERAHAVRDGFDTGRVDQRVASTADEIAFLKSMIKPETAFAVLVIPARFDVRDADPSFRALRRKMVTALEAKGITAIDLGPALTAAGFATTHFVHDGHWSAAGHAIAARAVAGWASEAVGR